MTGLMLLPLLSLFAFLQLADPIEAALQASDAPKSVRVAFEVELKSDDAVRGFRFDPRLEPEDRWQLIYATGEDNYLDEISAAWGAESAPDGRLFPDDLRESLGDNVVVEDLGAAWKLSFKHAPSRNDGEFDRWAAEQLEATAWLTPETGRFIRIEYALPRPVNIPEGGRLLQYSQSYVLEPDPTYQLSLITSFQLKLEARGVFRKEQRSYGMSTRNVEVFFATPEDEALFFEAKAAQSADALGEPR